MSVYLQTQETLTVKACSLVLANCAITVKEKTQKERGVNPCSHLSTVFQSE